MAKVRAVLDEKHPRKDKTCTVYIFTTVKSKPIYFNTKVSILPAKFDKTKQCVIGNSKEVRDQNHLINDCRSQVSDILVKYRLKRLPITIELLRKEFENPSLDTDFYSFWDQEMKVKKDFVKVATYDQHRSVLEKLKRFRATCAFSELDKDFITDYQRYCMGAINGCDGRKIDDKNNQNTINKNLKVIKVYISLAMKREIIKKSPFDEIKIKRVHPEIIFLDKDELDKLIVNYKKNMFPERLRPTVRRFLFSCFTSLRISDSLALTFDNIIGTTLVVKPQKTSDLNKIIRIPLKQAAMELLSESKEKKGLVFPKRAEQSINRDLKEIFNLIGIKKDIKTHSARHTFATMYYRLTRDIVGLQKLLGHSDLEHTLIYTHVVDTDIEEEMNKLDDVWKTKPSPVR